LKKNTSGESAGKGKAILKKPGLKEGEGGQSQRGLAETSRTIWGKHESPVWGTLAKGVPKRGLNMLGWNLGEARTRKTWGRKSGKKKNHSSLVKGKVTLLDGKRRRPGGVKKRGFVYLRNQEFRKG